MHPPHPRPLRRRMQTQRPLPTAANAVGAPMPCAALTAARYPFLTCVRGESGGPVLAAVGPGQEVHQMKIPSKFVSGDGYWGPSDLD